MKHFYNQEGSDDGKLGSEQWLLLFLLSTEIQLLLKRVTWKAEGGCPDGPRPGMLSIKSDSDAIAQGEFSKSPNRYFLQVQTKLLYC